MEKIIIIKQPNTINEQENKKRFCCVREKSTPIDNLEKKRKKNLSSGKS